MTEITKDFISNENREYRIKIGHLIASSLSGFICGAIVATILFLVLFNYFQDEILSSMNCR